MFLFLGSVFSSASSSALAEESPQETVAGYSVADFAQALKLQTKLQDAPGVFSGRKDFIETTLGPVMLRQPWGFDSTLRTSPIHLIRQAWNAASHFLAQEQFPDFLHDARFGWNVVVTNHQGLRVEGSKVSSEYCHTALMGPPADVLIDGYRLFHPCRVQEPMPPPETRLLRSLTHEVGHGIEYQLLGNSFSRRQRWHSEGFASWFEARAVDFLPNAKPGELRSEKLSEAKRSFRLNWRPYLFSGSPEDYSVSYALVSYLAERKGVPALLQTYARMSEEHASFAEAVEKQFGLSFEAWMAETDAYLKDVQ